MARVFVVSETDGRFTSELLDPATGSWRTTASLPRTDQDRRHGQPSRRDGPGGRNVRRGDSEPDTGRLPIRSRRRRVDARPGLAQVGYELVAMPDGGALAIGGSDGGELWGGTGALTARVHRFDPATGAWTQVASMSTPRSRAPGRRPRGRPRPGRRAARPATTPTGHGPPLRPSCTIPPSDRWVPGPTSSSLGTAAMRWPCRTAPS